MDDFGTVRQRDMAMQDLASSLSAQAELVIARHLFRKHSAATDRLRTDPGVPRRELDALKRGMLSLAAAVAAVSGYSEPDALDAVGSAWLAYGGPQALIDESRRRRARESAGHREYHRRQKARRRRLARKR